MPRKDTIGITAARTKNKRAGPLSSHAAIFLLQIVPQWDNINSVVKIIDVSCGSRMFWFDRADSRAIFTDNRSEKHDLKDVSSKGGSRKLVIEPDSIADFTCLPFDDESFSLVVFDPPHLVKNGKTGWLAKKYGKLGDD